MLFGIIQRAPDCSTRMQICRCLCMCKYMINFREGIANVYMVHFSADYNFPHSSQVSTRVLATTSPIDREGVAGHHSSWQSTFAQVRWSPTTGSSVALPC